MIDLAVTDDLPSIRQVECCYVRSPVSEYYDSFFEKEYDVLFKYKCRDGIVYLVRFPNERKITINLSK